MRQEKSRGGGRGNRTGRASIHTHDSTNGTGVSSDVVPIYDRRDRMIGEVNGKGENRQFQKHLRRSLHFLVKFNAWAWDMITLEQAEAAGARSVLIIDDETGQQYRASLATVWDDGFRLPWDEGQIALRLSHFRRRDEADQLALFGGAQ